jgi:hypothetical protein
MYLYLGERPELESVWLGYLSSERLCPSANKVDSSRSKLRSKTSLFQAAERWVYPKIEKLEEAVNQRK